jgi:hypothetical protein
MSGAGVSAYYKREQIQQLKRRLGINLESTRGLINERKFREFHGLSRISKYRKKGIIKPVGYALTRAGRTPFYHPRQLKEIRRKLGITLTSVTGLLTEKRFEKSCGFKINRHRHSKIIKPVGFAMSGPRVGPYYHPKQIDELKRKLGITLKSTKGLMTESEFGRKFGFSNIAKYRAKNLIKPVGFAVSNAGLSAYYSPKQAKPLLRLVGKGLWGKGLSRPNRAGSIGLK